MCRLQFSLPEAEPAGQQADGADQSTFAAEDVSALEALLALGSDSMDFELPGRALPAPAAEESGAAEPGAAQASLANAGKDDGRYHCPMPGCKRSFQELWRLKVHYRAPPNIRGSGKERGHGMRLTHCPKCGAALKVGGHHVKCAAVPKEPAGGGGGGSGRRNRKAAAARVSAADAAAAAAYAEPSYQQSQTAPAASSGRGNTYANYGLEMMQHDGSSQSLWQQAVALHAQQQQQTEESQDEQQTPYKPLVAGAPTAAQPKGLAPPAAVGPAALQRLASSDDSSSSRMVEGSCSVNDTNWGPSSSGYGSGSEDTGGQQQQQQEPLLSLFGRQLPAAAAELPRPVKLEGLAAAEQQQPQQAAQEQAQHPEAGQLLWQHMLLQHLQQHVQQTPGLSLPDLIHVASALFGNRVDTLVSAFGLSGAASATGQEQQAQQLSRLVAGLGQGDQAHTAAPGHVGHF